MNIKKIDIIIDNSEFYDFELFFENNNIKLDIIIDNSEFYDFELFTDLIDDTIDIILDNSEFYDFELTDIEIDINKLVEMIPICVDCEDVVVSLNNEYAFLLTDEYDFIKIIGGGFLQYH